METRWEENIQEEFTEDFLMTKNELALFDIDVTFENVLQKLNRICMQWSWV